MSITVTDLFCGGGGSSTGAIEVPDVEIRMAANHWDLAVEVHNSNHPTADHAAVDLHEEDPRYFPRTDILWASPECTKWSQASGGKYASISDGDDLLSLLDPDLVDEDPETAVVRRSRLLMFDVLRFAEHHRYDAMVIENVVDIATNARYAEAWALWKKSLRRLGYEHRVASLNSMHAQAHGDPAPQSRDRLYIVCWLRGRRAPDIDKVMRPKAWCGRCDTVVESRQAWKNGRTVGKYRAQYIYVCARPGCGSTVEPGYLPAATAIDWTLRGKRIGDRTKPLAEKTRARIAAGIARYWRPFHIEAAGNTYDAANPRHPAYGDPGGYYRAWSTYDVLRTLHTHESKALVVPLEGRAGDRVKSTDDPLRTQTSRHLDALTMPPFLTQFRERVRNIDPAKKSLPTIVADGAGHGLVEPPFIAELRGGGSDARPVGDAMSTVTASGNHHGLVVPAGGTWNDDARPATDAHRTLTTRETSALLTPYYGNASTSRSAGDPVGTLTTRDRYALIQRHAAEYLRSITTTGHQSLITPGDLDIAEAMVDDCLFRMLEPHEIAAGMAFPADYRWSGTRRERVKLAGNAVTPPAARDLIAAVAESLGADEMELVA